MENKNILLAAMSLDIGGAETHVFELAKELANRGHNILVASNGGAYVKDLEKYGIRHVLLPLHRKSPLGMLRAYLGLLNIISEQNIDIIHAHARIPAFLCEFAARKKRIPFVTTCHGRYKTDFIWRLFSVWGDYTLAVSYDIKDYLINNYSLFPDNIFTTVNAIDTSRFAPEGEIRETCVQYSDIEPDNIQKGNARQTPFIDNISPRDRASSVLYVGRIDKPAAKPVFLMLSLMERLCEKFPGFTLDIVGGGSHYKELCEQAAKVNSLIGREAVILHGARTDVEKFMYAGGVFAGVSRSALEAMSSGMDVLLAGAEGYIGILDEGNFPDAFATNFCCRGCGELTAEKLFDGLCQILSKSGEEHITAGTANRNVIMNNYTISRMTDDAEEIYRKAIELNFSKGNAQSPGDINFSKYDPEGHRGAKYRSENPSPHQKTNVIISGYYGFGNMGDDSLLQSIVNDLRSCKPDIGITVISKKPRLTEEIYHVKSIKRFNVFALKKELMRSKLLISGGGSLLTDVTSMRSLIYYSFIIRYAKRHGLKVMLYANGMGPFISDKSRKIAKSALLSTDLVTLREQSSLSEIDNLKISRENVKVTADPAFGLQKADGGWIGYLMKSLSLDLDAGYFAISVRAWHESGSFFAERFASACKTISERYGLKPLFLPMQASKDLKISEEIARLCGGQVISGLCASEVVALIAHTEFVIGMRLHSLIYTFSAGRPLIGLSYDPKIDALLSELEYPYKLDVANFSPAALVDYAGEIMRNRDTLSADVQKSLEGLREKAKSNAYMALELAERGISG